RRARVEPVGRLRAVARDDMAQLLPVGLGVLPDSLVALAQLRVRDGQAQLPDLGHVAVEELLPRLLVPLALDPPDEHRVLLAPDRVAVDLHPRAPPARDRLLDELTLGVSAVIHREDEVEAVQDLERILPA